MNYETVPLKYQSQINSTNWEETLKKINKMINKNIVFPFTKTIPIETTFLPQNGNLYYSLLRGPSICRELTLFMDNFRINSNTKLVNSLQIEGHT
jgi:hypothetical protein